MGLDFSGLGPLKAKYPVELAALPSTPDQRDMNSNNTWSKTEPAIGRGGGTSVPSEKTESMASQKYLEWQGMRRLSGS